MIPTVTPDWLTDRLRSSGVLATGHVTGVLPGNAESDKLLPFQAFYSPDAPPSIPDRFLIKMNLNGGDYGLVETHLYRDIVGNEPDPPVPPTYDVGYDNETGHGYLLQEDLTASHHFAVTEGHPPTIESLGALIDQIARVHALCWDHPRIQETCFVTLRKDITAMCGASSLEELTESVEHVIPKRLPMLFKSTELNPDWKAICETALRAWPTLYCSRFCSGNLTLIHGDLHPWNVFVPNEGDGPPLIFDWELLCRGLGAYDLCYLILRCRLPPEERRRFEESLIPHYHDRLSTLGVTDYDLETCREDYRLSVIPNILPPLAWQRPHNLISTMEAFFDWDCESLYS